ncbi:glycosyltransferase [Sphingomonas sp. GC_Shp_6]|uniref:glycosyltransferase n=1 Tax=Sphingomonas sp. GC_Shp_6 TaxID=2937378 RepID=UPI002269BA96
MAVCVPVRNEQAVLPRLLRALLAQEAAPPFHACFFLDSCTDDSGAVIENTLGGSHLPWSVARSTAVRPSNAGAARRDALAIGLERVAGAPGALLLTTDADSMPAPDWVRAAAAALGAVEIAAGLIVRPGDARDAPQDRIEAYYDRLYRLRRRIDPVVWEPDEGHHFTGGANLAMRADGYAALGGCAPLPSGEDAALIDAAGRAGMRVRRARAMVVETSSRRIGRAPGGLAHDLRRADDGDETVVAHPEGAAWQYRAHAAARRAFARRASAATRSGFGRMIGLSGDHVLGVARDCPNAEAFAMRIVPACPAGERPVPLGVAEQALAVLERAPMEEAA